MAEPSDPKAPPPGENTSELSDDELDPVTGGARIKVPFPPSPAPPSPSGPVPIPYPNVVTKE